MINTAEERTYFCSEDSFIYQNIVKVLEYNISLMGISYLISLALHCKLQHILSNYINEDEDEDDGDEDDSTDNDDVDIYIMMQCLSVTKSHHFHPTPARPCRPSDDDSSP